MKTVFISTKYKTIDKPLVVYNYIFYTFQNAQLEKQYQDVLRELENKEQEHTFEMNQLKEEMNKLRTEMEAMLVELQVWFKSDYRDDFF